MDKREKLLFAKKQLAEKWNCDPSVFDSSENAFFASKDTFFEIITFDTNAVVQADESILGWCADRFMHIPACDIMDGDNLYDIETKLRSCGKKLGGEHVRYLHTYPQCRVNRPEGFVYELFAGDEIRQLDSYRDGEKFDNAFSPDPSRDVLAIAAYDGETIAAIAGCDDYMGSLWQIGIDTLPPYRNRGLGAYLVKEIAIEIERNNKVAYYSTWSPNIASTRVVLSAGFYPVWMGYPCEDMKASL